MNLNLKWWDVVFLKGPYWDLCLFFCVLTDVSIFYANTFCWWYQSFFALELYHTFVYHNLNYCIHVWGKAYKTHLYDLVVLQNKAMRIIDGVPPRTNVDKFEIENILTVKHIYNYNIGLFMYKYVNKMTPGVFDNFFSSISDIHQQDTRNAAMKLLYLTFRGTTRVQKKSNTVVLVSSFKTHSRQLFLATGDDVV